MIEHLDSHAAAGELDFLSWHGLFVFPMSFLPTSYRLKCSHHLRFVKVPKLGQRSYLLNKSAVRTGSHYNKEEQGDFSQSWTRRTSQYVNMPRLQSHMCCQTHTRNDEMISLF